MRTSEGVMLKLCLFIHIVVYVFVVSIIGSNAFLLSEIIRFLWVVFIWGIAILIHGVIVQSGLTKSDIGEIDEKLRKEWDQGELFEQMFERQFRKRGGVWEGLYRRLAPFGMAVPFFRGMLDTLFLFLGVWLFWLFGRWILLFSSFTDLFFQNIWLLFIVFVLFEYARYFSESGGKSQMLVPSLQSFGGFLLIAFLSLLARELSLHLSCNILKIVSGFIHQNLIWFLVAMLFLSYLHCILQRARVSYGRGQANF